MIKIRKLLRNSFLTACIALPSVNAQTLPPLPFPGAPQDSLRDETNIEKTAKNTSTSNPEQFSKWLAEVRKEAIAKGISKTVVNAALPNTLAPIPRVLELDRKQPEKIKTLEEYLAFAVNPTRINTGVERQASYKKLLDKVSAAYNVEPEVIVAFWGMETSYGQNTGNFVIVNALATLAYDGRRSQFFRGELMNALKILDQEKIAASSLKGSWAGATSQIQFMPSSFFQFAVDFDRDGKRDIWTNHADIFASAANYLSKSGWQKGEAWGHPVKLPENFDRSLIGLDKSHPLQYWRDKGMKLSNGKDLPPDTTSRASIIQPDGAGKAAYIVYDNFHVILKWNRSNYFATSIGLLSDKIKADKIKGP